MAYPVYRGQKDKVHNTGQIIYGGDGTNFYPILVDSSGYLQIGGAAGTASIGDVDVDTLPQREPFIFRPGRAALASTSSTSGMVLSGVRSGGVIVASTAGSTVNWGTEVVYEPARAGKIDGIAASGVISGQITIGTITAAATCEAQHTMRIRNKGGTTVTCLALSGTVKCGSTTEVYTTYDIPQLLTVANFNAVPFGVAIGIQSNVAATACNARIMESSYIQGEFEPGT